jgi:hypothetical protein
LKDDTSFFKKIYFNISTSNFSWTTEVNTDKFTLGKWKQTTDKYLFIKNRLYFYECIMEDNDTMHHYKTKKDHSRHAVSLDNWTYESRWIIISTRFSITKRLEYRVWLNNLIFEGHRFLWGGKNKVCMRLVRCELWYVCDILFKGVWNKLGLNSGLWVCVCVCESSRIGFWCCAAVFAINRNLRIAKSYCFALFLHYHKPQVLDLMIGKKKIFFINMLYFIDWLTRISFKLCLSE